jgi:hypothetical protein
MQNSCIFINFIVLYFYNIQYGLCIYSIYELF